MRALQVEEMDVGSGPKVDEKVLVVFVVMMAVTVCMNHYLHTLPH